MLDHKRADAEATIGRNWEVGELACQGDDRADEGLEETNPSPVLLEIDVPNIDHPAHQKGVEVDECRGTPNNIVGLCPTAQAEVLPPGKRIRMLNTLVNRVVVFS
jgi:hypothetical protein